VTSPSLLEKFLAPETTLHVVALASNTPFFSLSHGQRSTHVFPRLVPPPGSSSARINWLQSNEIAKHSSRKQLPTPLPEKECFSFPKTNPQPPPRVHSPAESVSVLDKRLATRFPSSRKVKELTIQLFERPGARSRFPRRYPPFPAPPGTSIRATLRRLVACVRKSAGRLDSCRRRPKLTSLPALATDEGSGARPSPTSVRRWLRTNVFPPPQICEIHFPFRRRSRLAGPLGGDLPSPRAPSALPNSRCAAIFFDGRPPLGKVSPPGGTRKILFLRHEQETRNFPHEKYPFLRYRGTFATSLVLFTVFSPPPGQGCSSLSASPFSTPLASVEG